MFLLLQLRNLQGKLNVWIHLVKVLAAFFPPYYKTAVVIVLV